MTRKAKLLPIHVFGDKVLRVKAEPVTEITKEIKSFVQDLTYTMYERDGLGLAAPQVGKSIRIFVCDPQWSKTEVKKPLVFINPEIVYADGEQINEEGCLSVPDIFEKVKRFKTIKMKALDLEGNEVIHEGEELFAIVMQHEFDHLNGVLFIDLIPTIRKMVNKKRLKDIEKTTDSEGNNIIYDK